MTIGYGGQYNAHFSEKSFIGYHDCRRGGYFISDESASRHGINNSTTAIFLISPVSSVSELRSGFDMMGARPAHILCRFTLMMPAKKGDKNFTLEAIGGMMRWNENTRIGGIYRVLGGRNKEKSGSDTWFY